MIESIGSPLLWGATIVILLGLLTVDFVITRRPHDVPMREAVGWTVFYLALPVAFGLLLWPLYGRMSILHSLSVGSMSPAGQPGAAT